MDSLYTEEPITVKLLMDFLKRLLEKYPDAKDWEVKHVEFGAYTRSTDIAVDIDEKFVSIG